MTVEREIIQCALKEDIQQGDLSAALIPKDKIVNAIVFSRESAILCGANYFSEVFYQIDKTIEIKWQVEDGDKIEADQKLCIIRGKAHAILTAERTALNFLQLLSGTATMTREYVDLIRGTTTQLLDTRKTVPGLRAVQKYAVRCGGGHNHRLGLYDAILIKENHIAAAGSITNAVNLAQKTVKKSALEISSDAISSDEILIEVEVETLEELQEAIDAGVKRIMLDNFSLAQLDEAVKINRANGGNTELEASGGIDKTTVRHIAETGVDFISIGALTKHVRAVDLSLRFL